MGPWHPGMFGVGGWEGMIVGLLMMLLFWGGLFGFLFLVIRAATGSWRGGPDRSKSHAGAQEILDQRFARGEIDAQQYQEMKRTLEG